MIARALGMGMKLRQYELGKAWCDEVASATGIEGLNRVWGEPAALPRLAELEAPGEWLARISPVPPRNSRLISGYKHLFGLT